MDGLAKVVGGIGIIMGGIVLVGVLCVLSFGIRLGSLHIEGFFAKEKQNIEREVFENTKSFNEAKQQELVKYRFEWQKAKGKGDTHTMNAIESAVRHSFGDYDASRLPMDLRNFVNDCMECSS